MNEAPAKPRRLLPLAQVEDRVGLRKTAIYDRIARGEFPRPVRLGPQTVRWVENEIDEWIDASAEVASDQEEIEQLQAEPDRLPVKCSHRHADLPTCLYRHRSAAGELLYVGIALSPAARLQGHRSEAPWFREIASITVEWFENRLEAMRAEVMAIRAERPRFNRIHAAKQQEHGEP